MLREVVDTTKEVKKNRKYHTRRKVFIMNGLNHPLLNPKSEIINHKSETLNLKF